jgi:hypothetical protein
LLTGTLSAVQYRSPSATPRNPKMGPTKTSMRTLRLFRMHSQALAPGTVEDRR